MRTQPGVFLAVLVVVAGIGIAIGAAIDGAEPDGETVTVHEFEDHDVVCFFVELTTTNGDINLDSLPVGSEFSETDDGEVTAHEYDEHGIVCVVAEDGQGQAAIECVASNSTGQPAGGGVG